MRYPHHFRQNASEEVNDMAKKVHDNRTAPSNATKQPQQKKQDKKESKVKLAIEQVHASIAKAESKLAKLQGRVEENMSHLHELEAKLASMRGAPQKLDENATDHGSDHQQSHSDSQEVMVHEDVLTMDSQNEENHFNPSFEESQTDSDTSMHQAEASPVATLVDEPAEASVIPKEESSEASAADVQQQESVEEAAATGQESTETLPVDVVEPEEETATTNQESTETLASDIQKPVEQIRTYKRSPMSDLKEVPPEVKKNLESEGITNTQQFLESTRTQQQRRELAKKVGASTASIKEWVNCADLMRLRGVGVAFSTMLNKAGVHSCRELQQSEPEQLSAKLETLNTNKKLGHHIPTLAQVTEWIAEAKTLAATSPE
jgi:Domain of unknown function (DUF4332)